MACTYYRHDELQATEAGCPFCHPTSPRVINLNGQVLSPSIIEFISENFGDCPPVLLTNYVFPPEPEEEK